MNLLKKIWAGLCSGWDILRTVYWYNSLPWRILKSGALIVFGFFCLAAGNLLLSYKPEWTILNFLISYGFLLIIYGPVHHLIVIPTSLHLVHYDWGNHLRINRRGPFWTLIGFFVVVLYFGYQPLEVMSFTFQTSGSGGSHDINPEITCFKSKEVDETFIHCSLPGIEEISRVQIENSGKTIKVIEQPPFEFTLRKAQLEKVVGQRNFSVILRDSEDYMIRRYVRSVSMIPTRNHSGPGQTK